MEKRDFTISIIHSEFDQDTRDKILKQFKTGVSRVLIATDLVARGIDVHGVSLVINYDLPKNASPTKQHWPKNKYKYCRPSV